MSQFVIECSEGIVKQKAATDIVQAVYEEASQSGLFPQAGPGAPKVRLHAYEHYTTFNTPKDFIHVFAHIMQGRTNDEKKILSREIIRSLKKMFPEVDTISMNIYEFSKGGYYNSNMI